MTYFEDLSDYSFGRAIFFRPVTRNVGWLGKGYAFETAQPTEDLLDLVWRYCKVSIAQTRGIHECEFCPSGDWYQGERKGEKLLLGTSEIRVFGKNGLIYAAPTLIYHLSLHFDPSLQAT